MAVVSRSLQCSALVIQQFVANKLAVPVFADIVPLGAVVMKFAAMADVAELAAVSLLVGVLLQDVVCTPAAVGWAMLIVAAVAMKYMTAGMNWTVTAVPAKSPASVLHAAAVTKQSLAEPDLSAAVTVLPGGVALYLLAFVVMDAGCSVVTFQVNLTLPVVVPEQWFAGAKCQWVVLKRY